MVISRADHEQDCKEAMSSIDIKIYWAMKCAASETLQPEPSNPKVVLHTPTLVRRNPTLVTRQGRGLCRGSRRSRRGRSVVPPINENSSELSSGKETLKKNFALVCELTAEKSRSRRPRYNYHDRRMRVKKSLSSIYGGRVKKVK
mmetsp:Transcript_1805/g.2485  ORF Transcript_1805/g.2485 Transcript_1805/m.2485 type:complete len:145 (+) Transcript_1805:68-502(+)